MFYFSTFWSVVAAFAFQYIVARGLFYVDWPRLNKPDEAIFYGELPHLVSLSLSSGERMRGADRSSTPQRRNDAQRDPAFTQDGKGGWGSLASMART